MTRQICDLSDKLENSETALGRTGFFTMDPQDKKTEDKLTRVTRDASKTTIEALHGLMAQVIKDKLFNHVESKKLSKHDAISSESLEVEMIFNADAKNP